MLSSNAFIHILTLFDYPSESKGDRSPVSQSGRIIGLCGQLRDECRDRGNHRQQSSNIQMQLG